MSKEVAAFIGHYRPGFNYLTFHSVDFSSVLDRLVEDTHQCQQQQQQQQQQRPRATKTTGFCKKTGAQRLHGTQGIEV
ncbi:hypothetical protein TYRP_023583 [Tyrophagus putrescentiae]|nr:hypothetical protein TYRP_023583 [Tyrophagus putrescentiae]